MVDLLRASVGVAAIVLISTLWSCSEQAGSTASPAADCPVRAETALMLRDLDGNDVSIPGQGGELASVVLFTRSDCPISNRYAPEVRRIAETWGPRGVRFHLVYLDRSQPVEEIRAHMDEYDYPIDAVRDPEHRLVALTGATVTPEVAVFLPDGCMVYRGRIDDRWVDFGKARAAATRHDLELALEAVADDRPIDRPRTEAVGCFIPDLR